MNHAFAKASGIFLAVLAAVVAWLLVAAASLASAGGPNPLYLRAPHPVAPSSSTSALALTVVLSAAVLSAAAVFALVQRRADRRATLAEVRSIDAHREPEDERKAA